MFPLSDSDLPRRCFPFVNIVLIAASSLVFIYELTLDPIGTELFFYRFGLVPVELARGEPLTTMLTPSGLVDVTSPIPDWATAFTAMFIHGGWLHILGNMLFLWVFGCRIEGRFGHLRYLGLYLASGVAAAILQIAADPSSAVPNVGASGAIAGVLGAYILLYPYSRIRTFVFFFIITVVRIPAWYFLGFWFLLQFASGLGSVGLPGEPSGVAYWAHVGGFIFGLLAAAVLKLVSGERLWPRRPQEPWSGRTLD